MMKNLVEQLNLKYESRFNIKKAFKIIAGTSALLVGISFLDNPDSTYRFIGIAAIVVFIRIEMGSPFETVLTDESRQRWRARQRLAKWEDGVLDETKKDDTL